MKWLIFAMLTVGLTSCTNDDSPTKPEEKSMVELHDYEYYRNAYFFLDELYRANLPDFRSVVEGTDVNPENYIDPATLEVYVNDFNPNNDAEMLAKEGVARANSNDLSELSGWIERGTWHRLDPDNDYILVSQLGYIRLERPIQDRHALAVIYRTRGGVWFGNRTEEPFELKLLKARDARPEFPTWALEWKNVYRASSSFALGHKFDLNALEVQILKKMPGGEFQSSQEGESYLQVFGLDQHGDNPESPPDRLIDKDYIGLDAFHGHLIFPDQTPFDPQHLAYKSLLQDAVPDIYTSQQQPDLEIVSQYIIRIQY